MGRQLEYISKLIWRGININVFDNGKMLPQFGMGNSIKEAPGMPVITHGVALLQEPGQRIFLSEPVFII